MAFAYRDKYGILHVVGDRATADEFAGGPVKEVDVPNSGGYPETLSGEGITDYGDQEIYVGGNRRNGKPLAGLETDDPALATAVKDVLAKIGL